MKVFINPGHDLKLDPGACGFGLEEAEVVYDVGEMLEEYLVKAGIEVVGNLQDDDLVYVVQTANSLDADLFISIHCDSTTSRQPNGTTSFVWELGNQASLFAESVQRQICGSLKTYDRGVRVHPKRLYVLAETAMPAVLIELAFVSNAEDAELLRTKQNEFAKAIARAVTDYQLKLEANNE